MEALKVYLLHSSEVRSPLLRSFESSQFELPTFFTEQIGWAAIRQVTPVTMP